MPESKTARKSRQSAPKLKPTAGVCRCGEKLLQEVRYCEEGA